MTWRKSISVNSKGRGSEQGCKSVKYETFFAQKNEASIISEQLWKSTIVNGSEVIFNWIIRKTG